LYRARARYGEAEPLYARALSIHDKALGPDHPDVGKSLNNMALLHVSQGRYADAEPLYKRSLAIREKALGPDHPDAASPLNNLAWLYQVQGRFSEAEPLYKRALAIREKAFGLDHADIGTALGNLADLYRAQGRYSEAEPLYKRSLSPMRHGATSDGLLVALLPMMSFRAAANATCWPPSIHHARICNGTEHLLSCRHTRLIGYCQSVSMACSMDDHQEQSTCA
jgi:tetratricopeptide (TPR) repeat protein